MSSTDHVEEPRNFEPKEPVQLAPPKTDVYTEAELAERNGETKPEIWVGVNGTIFDVTGNNSYKKTTGDGRDGAYAIFAGKDASKALGKSSVLPEDVTSDTSELNEKEKSVLKDWYTFFSKRYNIVGTVKGKGAQL